MLIFLLILWYIIGFSSFVFWWTKDYDLEVAHLLIAFYAALAGPIAFLMGYKIHGDKSRDISDFVIIKKRK